MIDRNARDAAIATFEDYLEDRITAFEFDDRLQSITTKDQTVREIVAAAWFHYDDCKDHKVILNKVQWDYFQRLLLLLKSNAEIASSSRKRWSWDHGIAWLALIAFVYAAFLVGWNLGLFILASPFGILSMLISHYRQQITRKASMAEFALAPFTSYSQIRWLRRQVPDFSKMPYRTKIGERRIRSTVEESFGHSLVYILWLLLSPVILFAQGLPDPGFMTIENPRIIPKLS